MALKNFKLTAFIAFIALGGCSFASNALFPSLMGDRTQEDEASKVVISPSDGESSSQPTLDASLNGDFSALTFSQSAPTGTFVGEKVITFRKELGQLQQTIRTRNNELQAMRNKYADDIKRYHEIVAFINARLQVGTTPGNPKLTAKWQEAEAQLEIISRNITTMNQLSTKVASDSAMTSYLLDSIRAAFNISGAVEEDHANLRILEDETNQTSVLIERLLSELNDDIRRQQVYITAERSNQSTLSVAIKNGMFYGPSLSTSANTVTKNVLPETISSSSSPLPGANVGNRKPLLVIRFNKANVSYEQPLYQATKQALDRYPEAVFDLVAVTPAGQQNISGHNARKQAETVLRSLVSMGLPANNVRLTAMTSATAQSNEVHLYLR